MPTITVEISQQYIQDIQHLVTNGQFKNMDALIEEAVHRYLDSHTDELVEQFVQEDIQWGLYGND